MSEKQGKPLFSPGGVPGTPSRFPGRGPGGPFPHNGPVVKPRAFGATMARLWSHTTSEKWRLMSVLGLLLAATALTLGLPALIGRIVDHLGVGMSGPSWDAVMRLLAVLAAAYLFEAMLSLAQGWLMAGISARTMKRMRGVLFSKLHTLPLPFFDRRSHGELMSRLSNDIELVSSTVTQSTLQLMSGAITLTGSLGMMIYLSWPLTGVALLTIPLVFLLTKTIAKRTLPLFKEQQAILGKLNGHIEETLSGMTLVKAFGQETSVMAHFDRLSHQLAAVGVRAQIWSGYIMPLMNVLSNLSFTLVAGAGGVLAIHHFISVGVIASFIIYTRQFARPLNDLANIFNTLQSAVAGAERVFEILDEKGEMKDPPNALALGSQAREIVFHRVCFGYQKDVPVLTDITFDIQAGSTVAVVGPTGAGKTTLINLLTRFYEIDSGMIQIGGQNILNFDRNHLRQAFAVVLQDTYLFSGSIRENIRYGRPDASDLEVEAAAHQACADPFIRRLPRGYDTLLTESGAALSQGQRQLLAIARAVLRNPSMLILDEATSNVDTRTELHLQEAMTQLMKGRTTLVIAHRLSTIRHANRILVISGGRLVEAGTHEELLARGGVYRDMTDKQVQNLSGG